MARDRRGKCYGPLADAGRLRARPTTPRSVLTGQTGDLHRLNLDAKRDALLYLPAGYDPSCPAPLVLMLHGAGGNAPHGLSPLLPLADVVGLILLAPSSRLQTWDMLRGGYGPDIAFIDQALGQTFDRYAVDPTQLAIEGFSDGASYALSVGIANGDLFTHIIAFSPGFMAPPERQGAPEIFISHGTHDRVLPIASCSRRIVPQLERAGYDLRYQEFDGGHTMPPTIVQAAVDWFVGDEPESWSGAEEC